ncbi:MAG: fibronectin type III domain-containing protein, partial [Bacillota bacterium]
MVRLLGYKWIFNSLYIWITAMLLLSSCVPKDQSLSKDSLSSTNGFSGLVSVQTLSATKVQLNWNASSEADVIAYNIYDSTLIFNPKLIKTVKVPATSATITGLTPANFYLFRVRAVKSTQSEDTNTVDKGGIPYAGIISAEVTSGTTASVTFSDGSNADKIQIYCRVGLTDLTETLMQTVSDTKLTTATLSNLVSGELYTCRAVLNMGGFEDNNLSTVSFIPLGKADQLAFTTQPSSGTAGVALTSQPVVSIEDANGNVITAGPDSTAQVTLTISTNSPTQGTIRGTATVNAVKGVATFSGLNIQEAGVKILTATKEDTSTQTNGSGPLTADSSVFTINPGPVSVTKSSISISPAVPPSAALVADGNSAYSVIISLQDQYGNPISGVKPQFTSSITGDTLVQPMQATGADGQATGSISTIIADETVPYRTLTISSPSGLSTLTTFAPFVPGPATRLGYLIQPVNSPAGLLGIANIQVAVMDANGNIVNTGTASTSTINMTIASNVNGAVLSGTTSRQAIGGVVNFNDLGIDKTGTGYKLLASSGSYSPAYSNAFNVTAGVPQKISIAGASTVLSGNCSAAITVQLQDNGGNAANAIQNTPLTVSGLGGGALYSSSTCGGSPLSTTLTFTAGTNTKTVYLKDTTGEALTLTIKDSSNVLATGTRSISVTPDKISLTAVMPSPPAPAGTPMSVVAGACSPALAIAPAG